MFLGREQELRSLGELLDKPTASLVACRGRRRIGKSTLFKEFSHREGLRFIMIEGLGPRKGQTDADQIRNFGERLFAQTRGRSHSLPKTWMEAFQKLGERIPSKERTLVLLDEISWMGRHNPDFPGLLKNGWDDYLKVHDNLILAVCGSVSAWIRKNLLDSATFGGRFSRDIVLKELPLDLCIRFWGDRYDDLQTRDIIDVLSVTGGVPRYLEEINPSLSASENVRRMCFTPDGPLFKDFSALFSEVFGDNAKVKGDVLRALTGRSLTLSEISDALGVDRGGSLSENLDELVEAGFVSKDVVLNPKTWKKSRNVRYRLCDNYARFYLKYVEPNIEEIKDGKFEFEQIPELKNWQTIMGLAFENLVLNHVLDFKDALHLGGAQIRAAAPFLKSGKGGVQIDLLIQTDDAMYVVEVKRRRQIDAGIIDEVKEKVGALRKPRGMSIRKGVIYEGELSPSVKRSGYFDALVDIGRFMRGMR